MNNIIAMMSLILIVVAIALGSWRNVNRGLVCIAFALIVGQYIGGIKATDIINYWPTQLFFILLGVTFLFSIAKVNGTLELLARKSVYLAGGNRALIPIIFFILGFILAAIGPGNISMAALLGPIAMAVASETKISPVLMTEILVLGCVGGGLSPITPTGIIGVNLSKDVGVANAASFVWWNMIIASIVLAIIAYIVFGGYKRGEKAHMDKPGKFDRKQYMTLAGIGVLVISVIFLNLNVGLAAFFISTILLMFKVADEKKSFAGVPWGVLLLISGTSIMIGIATKLGGIKLLSNGLSHMMSPHTASAIMVITAGIMGFFSSASGVVMPTLIKTVPGLVQNLHGTVSPQTLIAAIVIGAHVITPSPLSTMGALVYSGATDDMDKGKLFTNMIFMGISGVALAAVLALIGVVK